MLLDAISSQQLDNGFFNKAGMEFDWTIIPNKAWVRNCNERSLIALRNHIKHKTGGTNGRLPITNTLRSLIFPAGMMWNCRSRRKSGSHWHSATLSIEPVDLYAGQLKILHFNSSEKSKEWTNITDNLDIPVVLKDRMVTFQIKISEGKIKMFSVYL